MKEKTRTDHRKIKLFAWGGVLAVVCYLCLIGIYTRLSSDPIIFFASVVIAVLAAFLCCIFLIKKGGGMFDHFTVAVIGMVYFMGIILLAVFGPTFIDRSISYHIAFYAADTGEVDVEDIRDKFSAEIFDKRIHDAVVSGALKTENDKLVPTWKAKCLAVILKPLGEITGSLDTYHVIMEGVGH